MAKYTCTQHSTTQHSGACEAFRTNTAHRRSIELDETTTTGSIGGGQTSAWQVARNAPTEGADMEVQRTIDAGQNNATVHGDVAKDIPYVNQGNIEKEPRPGHHH